MKLLLLPMWVRRVVTVPAMVLLVVWVLGLLPLWLVVAAFASRFVPGRWRALRLTWFAAYYLVLEVLVLAGLFALWVRSGFGLTIRGEVSIERHYRLMGWFLRRVLGSARLTFGLRVEQEGSPLDVADSRPALVLSRHAGAGDSFLLVDGIVNGRHHRRPRIVLKDVLQLDPAIDVMLNRVGAEFVDPSSGADGVAESIARLAAAAGDRDAVVMFPEGANFTVDRRRRAIDKLERIGRPDLAERARHLVHLLPPKPLGALAAIEAAPTATVVFVGHAGLEGMSTVREVWHSLPMRHTVRLRTWVEPVDRLPLGPDREAWLYDRWQEIDDWVGTALASQAAAEAARAPGPPPATLRGRLGASLSVGAAFGALVLWCASLTPSMLPRTWFVQGVVGAVCASLGVAIGGATSGSVTHVLKVLGHPLDERWREIAITVVLGGWVGAAAVGPWLWLGWQRDQAAVVGSEPPTTWWVPLMLATSAVLVAVIVTCARIVAHAVAHADRQAAQRLPVLWSRSAAVALILAAAVGTAGLSADGFVRWADASSGAFDTTTAVGVAPPTAPTVSSGPGSLVAWKDLGYEGRSFVAGAPRPRQLSSARNGAAVKAPIRVYVGLTSADTVEHRVELALAELRRTGAFERKVLVVVTPTGTGWVTPDAARAIEYLYGGDTAVVSVQYSFLPSWIAFLLDRKSPSVLGQALFTAVHAAWAALPAERRPKLVVFGESLGSFGGESAFAGADLPQSVKALTAQVDGALFVGPTANNPIYRQIVTDRAIGSPPWRPVVSGEPNLRIATRAVDVPPGRPSWPTPRVLYLHHPSDAVGTWSLESIWREPGWARDPTPYDIPAAATWVPLVGFVQESFDLLNGFTANPGYGHDYSVDFVDAWAAVLPPPGWTPADTSSLVARLQAQMVQRP